MCFWWHGGAFGAPTVGILNQSHLRHVDVGALFLVVVPPHHIVIH
jgi:hypothetical protein